MSRPLHVVQIITGLSIGGAERMLLKLLSGIDRDRFRVDVVSLTTRGQIGPKIEALGIPVYALHLTPGRPNLLGLVHLAQWLRTQKPDVVHTWMYHADLLGGIAARLAGCSGLGWSLRHSNLTKAKNKRTTLWVVRACALLSSIVPDVILSCSEKARTVHVEFGYCAAKTRVIPNGFDLTEFRNIAGAREDVRRELAIDVDTPLVGMVARYDPQKNHLGFVEAAKQVHASIDRAHFLLVGSGVGQQNGSLMTAIRDVGLDRQFHLLGLRNDVVRLMSALDILVSASDGEAFPNVLGEAMACGVPCVTTDAGDSAEIIGETGMVSKVGDMSALAKNMVAVLRMSPSDRNLMGQRARSRVTERYEIGQVTRQYEHFYEELYRTSQCAE